MPAGVHRRRGLRPARRAAARHRRHRRSRGVHVGRASVRAPADDRVPDGGRATRREIDPPHRCTVPGIRGALARRSRCAGCGGGRIGGDTIGAAVRGAPALHAFGDAGAGLRSADRRPGAGPGVPDRVCADAGARTFRGGRPRLRDGCGGATGGGRRGSAPPSEAADCPSCADCCRRRSALATSPRRYRSTSRTPRRRGRPPRVRPAPR